MASRHPELGTYGFRRIIILLIALVVVPTFLLLAVGTVLLFLDEARANLLMGILVLALSGAAATGVVLVWVFVQREANLSRLQSDFVSKVSHELRTPLTSIRLFTETLELRRGDAGAEEQCIQALSRESRRLQELIDRLLDWGRMEAGRREFILVETDSSVVARDALRAFSALGVRRGVEVQLIEQGVYPLLADGGALADAVLNLLTNALKYGGEPPHITLTVSRQGKQLRLAVTDDGMGIAKAEHQLIFQKFYRADDRLAREREGSGLGLAIVQHVVRAHRGRIEVQSAPGRGSVFTIVLPVLRDEPNAPRGS